MYVAITLEHQDGALLNEACRYYDKRIGQSVTLSGRQVVKHMSAKINEIIEGEYDYRGRAVIYGDSVTGDSLIRTDSGDKTIEQMFSECREHFTENSKDYGILNEDVVIGYDSYNSSPVCVNINYVMRHRTKKKLYKITTINGKQVTVTEDHSLIVDRNGMLINCKPSELQTDDGIITFSP